MGSKGSQTTTSTSSPNPTALASYYNLLNQAGNVAGTPYTPYTGPSVAPVNPEQYAGIGNINTAATSAFPFLTSAGNMVTSAAAPLTGGQINQYYSPYQQDVVNATEQQFQNINQQQQEGLLSGAAAQGALGGDRVGVMQGTLAGQQAASEAPVIAGLENTGFGTAAQLAMQQFQQNPENAAFALGNIGTSFENAGLTGGNAEVGAGTLEQQTQQAQNTFDYQQFLNQLAYPFQTTQWLAGIDTGVGSQMGGTGTTTGPAPSLLSQLTGGLLGGVGILGGTGAFGSQGYLNSNSPNFIFAKGGAVEDAPHFDTGGGTYYPQFGGGYGVSVQPYSGGRSFVPGIGIAHGAGAPRPPGLPQDSSAQMMQNAAKLAASFGRPNQGGAQTGPMQLHPGMPSGGIAPPDIGSSPEVANILNAPTGTLASDNAIYKDGGKVVPFPGNRGGKIVPFRKKGGGLPMRAGMGLASFPAYADGGSPDNDNQTIVPEQFEPAQVVNSRWADVPASPAWYGFDPTQNIMALRAYGQLSPMAPAGTNAQALAADPGSGITPPVSDDGGQPAMAFAPQGGGPAQPLANSFAPDSYANVSEAEPAGGVAPPAPSDRFGQGSDRFGQGSDLWPSLLAAGLGMMSSRSPFPGVAIGEGGLQGLAQYGAQQQQHLAQRKETLAEQREAQDMDLRVRQLNQQAKAEQDRLGQQAAQLEETRRFHQFEMGKPQVVQDPLFGQRAILQGKDGSWRYVDTGEPVVGGPAGATAPDVGAPGAVGANAPAAAVPQSDDPARPFKNTTASSATAIKALQMGLHGQAMLDAVPPMMRNTLEAVANYDAPITDFTKMGRAGMSQDRALALVRAINPEYNQNWYALQGTAYKNFFTGTQPQSPNVLSRAYNTAIGHGGELAEAIQQLHTANPGIFQEARSAGVPFLSYLAANVQQHAARGTPEGEAWTKIGAILPLYGAETEKFYAGSPGSETGRQAIQAPFNPNLSYREMMGALYQQKEMFKSKVAPLEQEYAAAMDAPGLKEYGTKQNVKQWYVARDNAQRAEQTIDRVYQDAGGQVGAPSGSAASKSGMSAVDQQASAWAKANPNDPRAAAIKQRLGVQ